MTRNQKFDVNLIVKLDFLQDVRVQDWISKIKKKSVVLMRNIHHVQVPLSNWVRGIMVLDVGCDFHDRGSIPSECQIPRGVDLREVNFTIATRY